MNEPPIINSNGTNAEIDSGSCDRISLLRCMLEGSYTESDTNFGKDNPNSDFEYSPNLGVIYILKTDEECFAIQHSTAFINKDKTRVIPLQTDSRLDIIRIAYDFMSDVDIVNSKIK